MFRVACSLCPVKVDCSRDKMALCSRCVQVLGKSLNCRRILTWSSIVCRYIQHPTKFAFKYVASAELPSNMWPFTKKAIFYQSRFCWQEQVGVISRVHYLHESSMCQPRPWSRFGAKSDSFRVFAIFHFPARSRPDAAAAALSAVAHSTPTQEDDHNSF